MHILKRIARASVWAKDGVKPEDYRYRGIFRFVLPATDLLFFYFGLIGVLRSVGSVADATGATWQTYWSAGIAITALLAFVGVAFPRLWAVEAGAKVVLIGLVSVYLALHLTRGAHDPSVTATAGLMLILILTPIWRLGDLGLVWSSRSKKNGTGHDGS